MSPPGNTRLTPKRPGYATKPLVVHPTTYVMLSQADEERAMAAFAELLAPLFHQDGALRCAVEDRLDL